MGKNIALKNMLKRQMGATRTVMGVERIKVRIAENHPLSGDSFNSFCNPANFGGSLALEKTKI